MEFSGKVVLVTGAGSGISAACAASFATQGAKLSLVDIAEAGLRSSAASRHQLSQLSPLEITADISNEADIERIIDNTISHYGRLDVLVNNAGTATNNGFQGRLPDFDRIMATNLRGPYHLTFLAIPHLVTTKGNVVNISSIRSNRPYPEYASYCLSKAALDMMTKCHAIEFGPKGVRVNSVNPGLVRTDIYRKTGSDIEEVITKFVDKTPLRRCGELDDVAELVLLLASERARFITGGFHVVDGGITLAE